MNEDMMNEILKRLDLLGAKLGEGAEFAWAAYMRQALVVNGWAQAAFALLLAGIACGLVRLAFWFCRPAPAPKGPSKGEDRYHYGSDSEFAIKDDANRTIGAAFSGVAAVIVLFMALVSLWSGIEHIINPQYYALHDLARMLGK